MIETRPPPQAHGVLDGAAACVGWGSTKNTRLLPHLKRAAQEELLHESSRARTRPTDRILTCRCDTTPVGRGR